MQLLFVCTGNICRSPIGERLAESYAQSLQIPDFHASSAGTRAVIGHPIHADAARVLHELGGDPRNFAARQLKPAIAADADLILTMTRFHRDAVLEMAPRQLRRTFTLAEAAWLVTNFNVAQVAELATLRPQLGTTVLDDVADPIGQPPEVFSAVGAQIAELLGPVMQLCASSAVIPPD
jgi:protein-tyrosine phosphatase